MDVYAMHSQFFGGSKIELARFVINSLNIVQVTSIWISIFCSDTKLLNQWHSFHNIQLLSFIFEKKRKTLDCNMSDALKFLQTASIPKNISSVKLMKWDDVPLGRHPIEYFKLAPNNYGLKLYVYLKNLPNYVILPDRFTLNVNQDIQVDELNAIDLVMTYKGKDKGHFNFLRIDIQKGSLTDNQYNNYSIVQFISMKF